MRFAFTDEQNMMRKATRDLLGATCHPQVVRAVWNGDDGASQPAWRELAAVGVLGMLVPESHGGMSLSLVDLVAILEEAGRAALPEPLVDTTAALVPLLVECDPSEHRDSWLTGIASGTLRFGVSAPSVASLVPQAHRLDGLVFWREDAIRVAHPQQLVLSPQRSVDRSRRLSQIHVDGTPGTLLLAGERGSREWALLELRACLGTAAELLGLSARMLEMTVEYSKARHQFGSPIGSFQAVKHHLADAWLALDFARPLVYQAAWVLSQKNRDATVSVSLAKAQASDAAWKIARIALQVHGAIGYTTEYDLHLYMKRAFALAAAWGDGARHREKLAKYLLDGEGVVSLQEEDSRP